MAKQGKKVNVVGQWAWASSAPGALPNVPRAGFSRVGLNAATVRGINDFQELHDEKWRYARQLRFMQDLSRNRPPPQYRSHAGFAHAAIEWVPFSGRGLGVLHDDFTPKLQSRKARFSSTARVISLRRTGKRPI